MSNYNEYLFLLIFAFAFLLLWVLRLLFIYLKIEHKIKLYVKESPFLTERQKNDLAEEITWEKRQANSILKKNMVAFSILIAFFLIMIMLLPYLPFVVPITIFISFIFILSALIVWIKKRNNKDKLIQQLPDSIDHLVLHLTADTTLSELIQETATKSPQPISKFFKMTDDAIKSGLTAADAISQVARKIHLFEFDFFAMAMALQQETGADTIKTLRFLSDSLREEANLQLKIKALTAEGKMSLWIIGSLPFISIITLSIIQPSYAKLFFVTHTGNLMLLAIILLNSIGIFWINRIIRVDQQ